MSIPVTATEKGPAIYVPFADLSIRRYRCGKCGNQTRFDVSIDVKIRYYHHQGVGVGLTFEEVSAAPTGDVHISCRGCDNTDLEVLGEITWDEFPKD